jgi:hypothetical protein
MRCFFDLQAAPPEFRIQNLLSQNSVVLETKKDCLPRHMLESLLKYCPYCHAHSLEKNDTLFAPKLSKIDLANKFYSRASGRKLKS